jgi:preprotein translocase subunit SecE
MPGTMAETQGISEKIKAFFHGAIQFFREVKVELLKVTFPTRQETVGSTMVVLVLTVIVSVYLGFSDWALSRLVKMLLQAG